jgi:hypothetical protein
VVSDDKRDEFGALALGAKLEKALARRMSGQDASFGGGGSSSAGSPKKLQKKRDESDQTSAGGSAKAVKASAA